MRCWRFTGRSDGGFTNYFFPLRLQSRVTYLSFLSGCSSALSDYTPLRHGGAPLLKGSMPFSELPVRHPEHKLIFRWEYDGEPGSPRQGVRYVWGSKIAAYRNFGLSVSACHSGREWDRCNRKSIIISAVPTRGGSATVMAAGCRPRYQRWRLMGGWKTTRPKSRECAVLELWLTSGTEPHQVLH